MLERFSVFALIAFPPPAALVVPMNSEQIFPRAFSPSSPGIAGCPRQATHPCCGKQPLGVTSTRREEKSLGKCVFEVNVYMDSLLFLVTCASLCKHLEQGVVSNPFPLETSIPSTSSRDPAFQAQVFPPTKIS